MKRFLPRQLPLALKFFIISLCLINGADTFAQGTPLTKCFADNDGDGFGNPNDYILVQEAFGCGLYSGRVTNDFDCDDNDKDVNPNTVWYEDKDNDEFKTGGTLTGCTRPPGYRLKRELHLGGSTTSSSLTCSNGVSITRTFDNVYDFDDYIPNTLSDLRVWYIDHDGDGFPGDINFYFFSSAPPLNSTNYVGFDRGFNGTASFCNVKQDCNDFDPLFNIDKEWYLDGDGDGFPLNSTPEFTQCQVPPGGFYKTKDQLLSSEFEDCDDTDPAIYPATWYEDLDGDGISTGKKINACGQPDGYISLQVDPFFTDCDDTDPDATLEQPWFPDLDGDKHGVAEWIMACKRPEGYFKSFELATKDDCNDNDKNIHPGATEFCNGIDDDCDGQIDETYCCPVGNIIYVNAANTGAQDGTSWTKAFKSLQDALETARRCANVEQIWVAGGSYYPDEGGTALNDNINVSFIPGDDLEIYGGFTGTETLLSQRNLSSAPSILSGEIQQDNIITNNTNNIVLIDNISTNFVLDGFIIRDGYSNIAFPTNKSRGIGILVVNSNATRIKNCIITQNTGTTGVAITNVNSNVGYINCIITGNSSFGAGGAIWNEGASPGFINCSVANNSGAGTGFIVTNSGTASPIFINTIVRGTSPAMTGGTPMVAHSLIQAESVWPGTGNIFGDPLFVNEAAGNLHLQQGSPAANAGFNNFNSEEKDIAGNPRKIGIIDLGAYESPYACSDPSLWVIDKDEDGYYPGDPVSACEAPGEGYVVKSDELPGDCNDDDKTINPTTIWYIDTDNDGYYRTGVVYGPSCTPAGPAFNTITTKGPDCNDNDAAINPETIWYRDADKDGYNSTFFVTRASCTSPGPEYVTSTLGPDCDDTNSAIGAPAPEICDGIDNDCDGFVDEGLKSTFYKDADGDGFTDGTASTQCTRPTGYKLASELLSDAIDCNDGNVELSPITLWFKDEDDDGFSDGTSTVQCTRPADYKLRSELTSSLGDCDDKDALLNPTTFWYKDGDGDGYSDGTIELQCTRPAGYKLDFELISSAIDCNDADPTIMPTTVWYKDVDNDGYSDGTTSEDCSRPTGYKLQSELTATSGDCDDTNAAIKPTTVWYKDADNDGYSDGTTQTQCTRPTGYKLASALTATSGDCNDANGAIHPATVWYRDADNDLYSDGTSQTQCARPVNYKLASELTATSGDCNDANAAIKPTTVWYKDADNDLYSDGTTQSQCTRPVNYKLASELTTSGDCNDANGAIHPGAAEICDGIDNDCDGLIDEGVKLTFYKDADADGYGNAAISTQACSAPAGYVSNNTDCSDNDPTVNPGAVEVCGNGKDDNCNNVQNEQGCYNCGNATGFSTTNITSNSATLNWVSIPNPNYWQVQYKSTKPGSKWVDVKPDPTGNKRSVQITGLSANQSYLWHIKARCGNSWTDYSVSVPFTTTGAVVTQTRSAGTPDKTISSIADAFEIKALPNPSRTSFAIIVKGSNLTEPVQLIVTDILGRVIERRITTVGQTITIGNKLISGIYLVHVVQGNETRNLKLIKISD